jgi:iron complex outermembrane recepter protein
MFNVYVRSRWFVRAARVVSAACALVLASAPSSARAQTPVTATAAAQAPVIPALRLPVVTVVAQKEPAPIGGVPVSVTAVSARTLEGAGIAVVSEAALFAPNTFYSDLSARKISNARFRGIGSSPANPGITTFVDGVPQLNTNTANLDLLDVEQLEFVRGAQSALFGRNTLGGVVNVTSRRPSLSAWSGIVRAPLGNSDDRAVEASATGPVVTDRLGVSFAMRYGQRDGFTTNSITGNSVDDRSAFAGKGQVFFKTDGPWQAHVVVAGERDRDGDYTLGDLAAIRQNPFTVARDFEGRTERDVMSATFAARRAGRRVTLSTTTGIVDWRTFDETDLDYTPFPAVTRANDEEARQFTQEVRVSAAAPVRLSGSATLNWQAGVFGFTQAYTQDAVNRFAPFVLSRNIPFAVANHSPEASLDDVGIGAFGHATVTLRERVDLSAGVRIDRENKEAVLRSFYDPAIAPANTLTVEKSFSSVSPQVAAAFRAKPGQIVYGSVGRGFKAGGFNPASPSGSEAYGEEQAWHIEGGVKSALASGRVALNAAVFAIDWADMQLNLPNVSAPGQFYIANVGGATSRGLELDLTARVHEQIDVVGALGVTRARFKAGSRSSGVDVANNKLPSTPGFTAMFGGEFTRAVTSGTALFVRGEAVGYGAFEYDDLNTARQAAYALVNFRAGVRRSSAFVEAWVRNAFDTRYVPVAFAYDPGSAPSGFLGEPGRPRTFGVRAGVGF